MKSQTFSSYHLLGLVLASTLGLLACGEKEQPKSTPEDIRARTNLTIPVYKVAIDADYPPYDFRDDQGNAAGFDVDIIQAIGEKQGFKVQVLPMKWSALLDSLEQSTYDIAMGGIALSDIDDAKYLKLYQPSNHYFYGKDAIGTKVGVNNIKTFNDLKNYKVATLAESGYVEDLTKLQGKDSDMSEQRIPQ